MQHTESESFTNVLKVLSYPCVRCKRFPVQASLALFLLSIYRSLHIFSSPYQQNIWKWQLVKLNIFAKTVFFSTYSTKLIFIKPTVFSKKRSQFKLCLFILDTILLSNSTILISVKMVPNGHPTATSSYYKYTQSLKVKRAFHIQNKNSSSMTLLVTAVFIYFWPYIPDNNRSITFWNRTLVNNDFKSKETTW